MSQESDSMVVGVSAPILLYSIAVVIAAFLSFVASLGLLMLGAPIWIVCAVTGFVGVFMPSFCVPRSSRWFCAIFLSVLGTGFYYFRFVKQEPGENPELMLSKPASTLVPLIFGGLMGAILHWRWQRSINRRG